MKSPEQIAREAASNTYDARTKEHAKLAASILAAINEALGQHKDDSEMLDWIESHGNYYHWSITQNRETFYLSRNTTDPKFKTARAAIKSAMKETK